MERNTTWNVARKTTPGRFAARFHPRILGTPAPVFRGFEFDITERLDDDERTDVVWHRERARRMLKAHPEIRALFGNTPSTAVWCALFALLQIGLAIALVGQPIWLVTLVAYVVGAWANINLFMLAHECNHSLVFKNRTWNRWLFTLTSLPMFLSAHHTWWIEHQVHHSDQGSKKDFIKRRRTLLLLTRLRSPMVVPFALVMLVTQVGRSLLGLLIYAVSLLRLRLQPDARVLAILADEHLVPSYRRYRTEMWAVTYSLASLGMMVALYWLGGWIPLLYLLLSQVFMTGFLHPLLFGMILSNSHFHGHRRYQPTSSHYGWLNWITFHFGLHTEHHDFDAVPWSRLPALRRVAPEFYDNLTQTPSYAALAFQFVFGAQDDFEEHFDMEERRNAAMLPRGPGDQPS